MSVTTTMTRRVVDNDYGRILFRDHGCFGGNNSYNGYYMYGHDGANNGREPTIADHSEDLEIIEFWPHVTGNQSIAQYQEAVDLFNSMACYKDMFTLTVANSIAVNLRENPADKVFTGLMTIRDYLYGNLRGMDFLWEGIEDKEELLKRKRIALILRLAGVSVDMFGRLNTHGMGSNTNESAAIYLNRSFDAMCLYALVTDDVSVVSDVWAQNPVGEGNNVFGYRRNNRSELPAIRRERGYSDTEYSSMSDWLRAWAHTTGHKSATLDTKRGRLTIDQIINRIRDRIAQAGTNSARADVIMNVFEELKEFYND